MVDRNQRVMWYNTNLNMAYVCFNCGKKTIRGTQKRHRPGVAGRQHLRRAPHTPKYFKPNLQTAYLTLNGETKKVKLCTKCRRLLKKQGKIRSWSKKAPSQKETIEKTIKQVAKEEKEKIATVEELVGKKS